MTIRAFYDRWPQYNRRLTEVVAAMSDEQLAVRPAPERWPWDSEMLPEEVERWYGDDRQLHSRASILQRVLTHDAYHCGELSQTLGIEGLPQIDLWRPDGRDPRASRSPEALGARLCVPVRHRRGRPLPAVQPLDSVPVLVFFALFALVTLACYEGGFRIGRWVQDRTADVVEEGPNGVLVGSIVALMAFLLAITTGMASDRFDARRLTVIEEANAIQTAYLRAGYIAEPGSSEARALLEAYVPLRIASSDPVALEAAIVKSEELQRQLWAIAEKPRARTARTSPPCSSSPSTT